MPPVSLAIYDGYLQPKETGDKIAGPTENPMIRTLLLLTAPLFAHDMWIEPTSFSPQAGEIVAVRLRVGQDLLGDPLPRDPALIKQFVMESATGRSPVIGRDGANPAGLVRIAAPGLHIIGYNSNPSTAEQTPEKFAQYVKEEGLEAIVKKLPATTVRELFSRCAKSLMLSGAVNDKEDDRVLGFPLELVVERNPYSMKAGDELPVRLTYEGKPLAGALIVAMSRKHEKQSARSDKDGRVRLRLEPGGMWMIKAVHMIPAPQGSNADWQSYWASLTFGKSIS